MATHRVKIDFLVPGFSKCGTTTLCAMLATHPGIYIPAYKEPWYFNAENIEDRTADYQLDFAPALPGQLRGEGSVSYSSKEFEDVSIQRIGAMVPGCRFIFIARNPWKRIESSYREMHHSGVKFGLDAPYGMAENLNTFPQMIDDSCFFERVSKYVTAFGADAILVLFLEDFQRHPQQALARCFRHLGLDDSHEADVDVRLNEGSSKLYDSRLLRYLRNQGKTGPALARVGPQTQDRWLQPLGLRRHFRDTIQWDRESIAIVEERVLPDSRQFLASYGKPADFWDARPLSGKGRRFGAFIKS
jgi:Sulfotransferase domain